MDINLGPGARDARGYRALGTEGGTMPRVCVLLANGFEEIEAMTIIDVLRRADLEVVTAAVPSGPVEGAHKVVVQADRAIADVVRESWDLGVLPGGMPGASNLRDDP